MKITIEVETGKDNETLIIKGAPLSGEVEIGGKVVSVKELREALEVLSPSPKVLTAPNPNWWDKYRQAPVITWDQQTQPIQPKTWIRNLSWEVDAIL